MAVIAHRLSIVITAHNCDTWLAETLSAVMASLGDAEDRCEIVIINDASIDGTQTIIDHFAASHRHIRTDHTELRNIGKVRNHAVAMCRGEYILMIDGDDSLLPGAIQDHLKILDQQHPDIWLSKIIERREHTRLPDWQYRPPLRLSREEAIERFLIHRDFQAHFIGQYFRRDLLLKYPFPDFICYEDAWLFPLILMHSTTILFSAGGFYLYRKHQTSLSTVMNEEKIRCLLAATEHMDNVLPAHFQPLITCHWIDIMNRHQAVLKQTGYWAPVKQRVHSTHLLCFLLNRKIRLSYKRKRLKVR